MSSKRIDADLGSVSLALVETVVTALPFCPEQRSADGLRLRALLACPAHDRFADVPSAQDIQEGYARAPTPFGHFQRLTRLADCIELGRQSHKAQQGGNVVVRLPADLLRDAVLNVQEIEQLLIFELRIGDEIALKWMGNKLIELVETLASRINRPFVVRVTDMLASSLLAEAGKA